MHDRIRTCACTLYRCLRVGTYFEFKQFCAIGYIPTSVDFVCVDTLPNAFTVLRLQHSFYLDV